MKPLVSILIPAFNAQQWIAETIHSAVAQSWPRKEIIVVDDGSTDRTLEVARQFASKEVTVVSKANQGAAATRNHLLQLSKGDYIQWLDADDLLAPDKIERQLGALRAVDGKRILLSSPWAHFYYRTRCARFVPNSLWCDLSPVDWLLRKMGENLHMQTATWLTSRELAEAAGPWDIRQLSDDDGEYYCRVLLASKGTLFVPGARVFYRITPSGRLSYIGMSDRKKEALLLSMRLHIQYLRSLEESDRVRDACLTYLQNWYENFYPERPDIVAELQSLAAQLGGRLEVPHLRWKYAWMRPALGWKAAKWAQRTLPQWKALCARQWDKTMYRWEAGERAKNDRGNDRGVPQEAASANELDCPTGKAENPRLGPCATSQEGHKEECVIGERGTASRQAAETKPLVSILIPAFNAQQWIAETIHSAVAQTWPRKEIIVVDDGSTDRTLEVARQFASQGVTVVSQGNQGAAAARNHALQLSHGDYVQWLDADDLLNPVKIERQLAALRGVDERRILLSCPWAYFYYRTRHARFVRSPLWCDLTPVEWLLRKLSQNLHMQTATWLVSRELAEAAGPWDTRLTADDDGEYFSRVLLASERTRFVPYANVFYRRTSTNRLSYVGNSDSKRNSLFQSMRLHIHYIRSLEDSDRVRNACLTYIHNWYINFYPERPDIVAELQSLAAELQGRLEVPRLYWKYSWMKPAFGWPATKWAQRTLPEWKMSLAILLDKAMYRLETRQSAVDHGSREITVIQGS